MPREIALLTTLGSFELSLGDIPGNLRDFIPPPMPSLKYISLFDTKHIGGTLPTQIGLLTSLEAIVAARNPITGTIPSELGHLTYLDSLKLAFNSMTGR